MATAHPTPSQHSGLRPWNPSYTHSEKERWICVYPAYINSKKTIGQGRRIPKAKAVENPSYQEIRDVIGETGLVIGIENKVHPKERDCRDIKYRGRIRVHLKNDDGSPIMEKFPTRQSLLIYLGETIPKLKTRVQAHNAAQQQQSGGGGGGKGGKKKKGKK